MSFDDVKPGRTIRFNGDFDYNAEDHRLLECWAQFTDSGKRVPIRVVAS